MINKTGASIDNLKTLGQQIRNYVDNAVVEEGELEPMTAAELYAGLLDTTEDKIVFGYFDDNDFVGSNPKTAGYYYIDENDNNRIYIYNGDGYEKYR